MSGTIKGRKSPRASRWVEGQIVTADVLEEVPFCEQEGKKVFAPDAVWQKMAVIERHNCTERLELGLLRDLGIQGGAIASRVSHESHNLIVIGDNDRDMYLAVQELVRTQGGYTLVERERFLIPFLCLLWVL